MCVFCKIVKKEIPTNIIYEDDMFVAILDVSQSTKGHTLIFPKEHFENILELDEQVSSKVFLVVKAVTDKLNRALKPKGFNIISNNGIDAGQSIFHFHIHVIPRYLDDNVAIILPNNYEKLEKNFLSDLKNEINKF